MSEPNVIAKVNYTHDAAIDLIIAHPQANQGEIARMLGYTEGWLSRVIGSDAFRARLAERKSELVDPTLTLSVEERLNSLAMKSLDVVLDNLTTTKNVQTALKAMEISTKALGYGARAQNVAVQQNFVVALPAKAESAESWAANCMGGGQTIEGEIAPETPK